MMLDFVDHGAQATSLSQCPHKPGTPEWRDWQHHFIDSQTWSPARMSAARNAAKERAAAAGIIIEANGRMRWTDNRDRPPLNAATRRAQAALAEVEAETTPAVSSLADAWSAVEYIRAQLAAVFHDLTDAITKTCGDLGELGLQGLQITAPETRTIAGKPAGRIRPCHHGNPRGQCRDCSRHRMR